MITSDIDAHDLPQSIMQLSAKLTCDKARERLAASTKLRAIIDRSDILDSALMARVVCAICARIPLESVSSATSSAHTAPCNYAQSRTAAAIRDCKWIVQRAVAKSMGGRLHSSIIQAVLQAIPDLSTDYAAIHELVSAVCNKLVFAVAASNVHAVGGDVWMRLAWSVGCLFDGSMDAMKADLLVFLLHLSKCIPRPFEGNARRLLGVALAGLRHGLAQQDALVASAAAELTLFLVKEGVRRRCPLHVLSDLGWVLSDWPRHRSLASQPPLADLCMLILDNCRVPLGGFKQCLLEEYSNGKIFLSSGSACDVARDVGVAPIYRLSNRVLGFDELLQIVNSRFTEARAFQIASCGDAPLDAGYLMERLERAHRDAHPFVLACLFKALRKECLLDVQKLSRLLFVCVLKTDCRDVSLLVLDELMATHIHRMRFDELDRLVESLLALVESKELNAHLLSCLLTFFERRFEFEHWTLEAKALFKLFSEWVSHYPPHWLDSGQRKRLLALPFRLRFDSASWNAVCSGDDLPEGADLDTLELCVRHRSLSPVQSISAIKQLVKLIETSKNDFSANTLTIVDSMHHSPCNGDTSKVAALILIHHLVMLGVDVSRDVFLNDALKYLGGKVADLEPLEFCTFCEKSASMRGIEGVSLPAAQKILKHQLFASDPAAFRMALNVFTKSTPLLDCQWMAEFVIRKIRGFRLEASEVELTKFAAHVQEKEALAELVLVYSPDTVFKVLGQDEGLLARKMLEIVGQVSVQLLSFWCQSAFLRDRGDLFVKITSLHLHSKRFADYLDFVPPRPLLCLLPLVLEGWLNGGLGLGDFPLEAKGLFVSSGCSVIQGLDPLRLPSYSAAEAVLKGDTLSGGCYDVTILSSYILAKNDFASAKKVNGAGWPSMGDSVFIFAQLACMVSEAPHRSIELVQASFELLVKHHLSLPNFFMLDNLYFHALNSHLPKDMTSRLCLLILDQMAALKIQSLGRSIGMLCIRMHECGLLFPSGDLEFLNGLFRNADHSDFARLKRPLLSVLEYIDDTDLCCELASTFSFMLQGDGRFDAILRKRPGLQARCGRVALAENDGSNWFVLLTEWVVSSRDPSDLCKYLQWVSRHSQSLPMGDTQEDLLKCCECPVTVMSSVVEESAVDLPLPSHFAGALCISAHLNDVILPPIVVESYKANPGSGHKLLESLLAFPDRKIVSEAFFGIVNACNLSLSHKHKSFLMQMIGRVELDDLRLAYCVESLRSEGDLSAGIRNMFSRIDGDATLDVNPDYIGLLMDNSKDQSAPLKTVELESIVLAASWFEESVPKDLGDYAHRQIYALAKMDMPWAADLISDSEHQLMKVAVDARHCTIDMQKTLGWFAQHSRSTDHKAACRAIKLLDSVSRNVADPAVASMLSLQAGMAAAKLLKSKGRHDDALQTARFVVDGHREKLHASVELALALSRTGKWLEESRGAVRTEILEHYLEPAYRMSPPGTKAHTKALYRLAWFLDRQWTELDRSDLLQAKVELLQLTRRQLDAAKQLVGAACSQKDRQAMERNRMLLEAQYAIDQEEYGRLSREKTGYLLRLLEYYLKVLVLSSERDLIVFRFCSLWFGHGNNGDEEEEQMHERISPILPSVPSHKFLPLIYQLAAKYQTLPTCSRMYTLLTALLKRFLHKHPFHSILQFLALSYGSAKGSKRRLDDTAGEARNNAKELLEVLKGKSPLGDTIRAMERTAGAYIELAELQVDADGPMCTAPIPIPKHLQIRRLADRLPLLTRHLEADADGDYSAAVHLVHIEPVFKVIGGINLPKIIQVTGSDGCKYKQLVKGRDDLRQDAVVEQVFRLVNRLLGKRDACIEPLKCYRIVPLHQRAGVLEWVSEAMPIGDYLAAAHERLRPADMAPAQARRLMRAEGDRLGCTAASKLALFHQVAAQLRPVFRHFFLERFPSLAAWASARSAYTRSCASSSMMGYLMGLGDRHCQNILIDCQTGHLIHIDLNMIFEQGRTLRVPERVPFRLTADIRDAMGPWGVEHGFRRSAAAFLRLIRREGEGVLMVLEVFKHDPLHHWPAKNTAKPQDFKLADLQDRLSPSVSANPPAEHKYDLADRALVRVREKVEGREEGGRVSEEAQVSYLIQQATSPELLSQMYAGWQAWL